MTLSNNAKNYKLLCLNSVTKAIKYIYNYILWQVDCDELIKCHCRDNYRSIVRDHSNLAFFKVLSVSIDLNLECEFTWYINSVCYVINAIAQVEDLDLWLTWSNSNNQWVTSFLQLVVSRVKKSNQETLNNTCYCMCCSITTQYGMGRVCCRLLAVDLQVRVNCGYKWTNSTWLHHHFHCVAATNWKYILKFVNRVAHWDNLCCDYNARFHVVSKVN